MRVKRYQAVPFQQGDLDQGFWQERQRINRLNQLLAGCNRTEDIVKAASDHDYQQSLFREFGL